MGTTNKEAQKIMDKQFSQTTWEDDEIIKNVGHDELGNLAGQIVKQNRSYGVVYVLYVVEQGMSGDTVYHTELLDTFDTPEQAEDAFQDITHTELRNTRDWELWEESVSSSVEQETKRN